MIYGNKAMTELLYLPLYRNATRAFYEGSIDKEGGNADWDWFMFRDPERNNEWVIFDAVGPGCIHNFVQHRYPSSKEPTFRFYFDGEKTPRFTIRHSEFGEKYPFVEPVASRYIGPADSGRGPIRVVRSFVPMPFSKSCRVTSDVKLSGFDKEKGEGGWGHIVCHLFSCKPGEIKTFDPADDLTSVISLWKKNGSTDIIPFSCGMKSVSSFTLAPGESRILFSDSGAGLVSGIKIITNGFSEAHLKKLNLTAFWNGDETAAVDSNFGCFFANELGKHGTRYLLAGMDANGEYYNNFPMPYSRGAKIAIRNDGDRCVRVDYASVRYTHEYNDFYADNPYGVFRTSEYYQRKYTEGKDSIIAELRGSGHMAAAVVTGYGRGGFAASCEGDVRIHIDGLRTPGIESDGSESYSCYGWGFPTGPEFNPAGGYDSTSDYKIWSEARLMMGDVNPFFSSLRFGIESGGNNDWQMDHSGMVFWYGSDRSRLIRLAEYPGGSIVGTPTVLTSYFEGDDDDCPLTFSGEYGVAVRLNCRLPNNTEQVIIRRISDQGRGRQKARVILNGNEISWLPWYRADSNKIKRWLEDEYCIPPDAIGNSRDISVDIVPVDGGEGITFNSFGYEIYAVIG